MWFVHGMLARSQVRHRGPNASASGQSAFSLSQRFDDDRPVRSCQSPKVIRISSLYDASTRFDCHGDGMGVCEERGTGTGFGE
jgi:hypothetical protein